MDHPHPTSLFLRLLVSGSWSPNVWFPSSSQSLFPLFSDFHRVTGRPTLKPLLFPQSSLFPPKFDPNTNCLLSFQGGPKFGLVCRPPFRSTGSRVLVCLLRLSSSRSRTSGSPLYGVCQCVGTVRARELSTRGGTFYSLRAGCLHDTLSV